MISDQTRAEVAAECLRALPNEACGFVVNNTVIPVLNAHTSPTTHFAIEARDYARVENLGEIQAIYHSHTPDSPSKFSPHDIRACKQSNVPWLLYGTGTGNFVYADPTGNAPYLERQWVYGIHDCYSLVRDFYAKEFAIELDDFERGEELEWQSKDWQMFGKNYENQGFCHIDQPAQKGDILLMQMDAPYPNHVGVMSGEGNLFYHHLMDRLSQKAIWGGMWSKVTSVVLRHKSL